MDTTCIVGSCTIESVPSSGHTADLGIEGGEVVTPQGRARLNVYVAAGRVTAVSAGRLPAAEAVDVSGMLVMPGMIDAHVHLMDPADTSREDFPSGTAAAARAGVTTVIEHTHAMPVISPQDLQDKCAHLRSRSRVDFALGAHAWPDTAQDLAAIWAAGVAFLKAFTCTTHGVPGHNPAALWRLFDSVADCGALCLVHCEDESMTAAAERELRAAGRDDGAVIPAWRTKEAELTAVSTTAILARRAGARAVVAHASNPETIALSDGLLVETCPQYLTLLEREVVDHGALRKFTPPARARSGADVDAMWQALQSGSVGYVASDHAPSTLAQKSAGSIWDVHFGLPGLDTTLSVLLDGAAAGRIAYEQVVELYSQAPARIYGLWPAKGRLAPGADADIVVVDPAESWQVSDDDILSKAGWSPFSGRTLRGRAVQTYLRGRLIADEGQVLAEPGFGAFLTGRGTD
jgi:dihydroorotase (multifunctional complex type)